MTDPQATVERARAYLTALAQHRVNDRPLIVLARECSELRRQLGLLLAIIDDGYLAAPAPEGERARRAADLLAEVPESMRAAPEHQHHDEASAAAIRIASLGDDTAAIVTSWLRAARLEADADGVLT